MVPVCGSFYVNQTHGFRAAPSGASPDCSQPRPAQKEQTCPPKQGHPCLHPFSQHAPDRDPGQCPSVFVVLLSSCTLSRSPPILLQGVFYSRGTYWYKASGPNLCGCRHQQGYAGAILISWTQKHKGEQCFHQECVSTEDRPCWQLTRYPPRLALLHEFIALRFRLHVPCES